MFPLTLEGLWVSGDKTCYFSSCLLKHAFFFFFSCGSVLIHFGEGRGI